MGSGEALGNAFMNLCVNAVDAMPDGGTLTLRSRNVEGAGVEILVEDTGLGMPPEVLKKAMDPFFTTKEVGKGTGLGLALVYSTVKAHRGTVDLQSEPGIGTRVQVCLPAWHGRVEPLAEGAPLPQDGQRRLGILLVDDDELILRSTEMVLAALGHAVLAADSGEAALAFLEAGSRPDLVIMDLNMPGLGGAGTLPHLRTLCPGMPVLLVTGRVDPDAQSLAEAYTRVSLLPKPFTVEELQAEFQRL